MVFGPVLRLMCRLRFLFLSMGQDVPHQRTTVGRESLSNVGPKWQSLEPEKIGSVSVDYARLLVADVDALGSWKHDECLSGLADFVFWGADAEQAARALDA